MCFPNELTNTSVQVIESRGFEDSLRMLKGDLYSSIATVFLIVVSNSFVFPQRILMESCSYFRRLYSIEARLLQWWRKSPCVC
ncbi:hypothetical protein IQ07DRAFT_154816 [Pyrenochaeta sp. DS3sAY3a]|nr:hypothetical protein IQ07DRAFT_154816 [Pyrenochaeta sp. DS3sAY3a]